MTECQYGGPDKICGKESVSTIGTVPVCRWHAYLYRKTIVETGLEARALSCSVCRAELRKLAGKSQVEIKAWQREWGAGRAERLHMAALKKGKREASYHHE